MGEKTNIEWADSTWNPYIGCTKVSPACDFCYAERDTSRFKIVEWGAGKSRKRTSVANWREPIKWNSRQFYECASCGWRGDELGHDWIDEKTCPHCEQLDLRKARRRVFCASLADVFDNEVPIEWLADLLDLIGRTPQLDWLILTKRIGNVMPRLAQIASMFEGEDNLSHNKNDHDYFGYNVADDWRHHGRPPSNVWLGITVCNQEEADRDIQKLLAVPAAVRFLSMEPLLGAIDLSYIQFDTFTHMDVLSGCGVSTNSYCQSMPNAFCEKLDLVIVGGESGYKARPMHPDWVRNLRDQCKSARVPFFVKQLTGENRKIIKDLSQFPQDMRIREYPNAEQ